MTSNGMNRYTTTKILDIRIVAQEHLQPTLFSGPIISIHYQFVDWETEQPISDEQFDTLAAAEKRAYEMLSPLLAQMAWEEAEREEVIT
jgi:hypothetical protein